MMGQVRSTSDTVAEHTGKLEQLYAAEYTGMVRLAYTLVGSNAEAEDLVQDSFVEVARRTGRNPQAGCVSAQRRRQPMPFRSAAAPGDVDAPTGTTRRSGQRCR